jgi:hypothetical protein
MAGSVTLLEQVILSAHWWLCTLSRSSLFLKQLTQAGQMTRPNLRELALQVSKGLHMFLAQPIQPTEEQILVI